MLRRRHAIAATTGNRIKSELDWSRTATGTRELVPRSHPMPCCGAVKKPSLSAPAAVYLPIRSGGNVSTTPDGALAVAAKKGR